MAAGHYSVALPNSEILFHDIRYGGIEDVTPTIARNAARQLQEANEEFSLKLANNIFRRLIWNYIDLSKNFPKITSDFPETFKKYKGAIDFCQTDKPKTEVDIASFATSLFANLSKSNDELVDNAIHRLHQWGIMMALSNTIPNYKTDDNGMPGLLEGARYLFDAMHDESGTEKSKSAWEQKEADLKLYIALIIEKLSEDQAGNSTAFSAAIDRATQDFKLIQSINAPQHFSAATRQLLRHKHVFFEAEALAQLESGDDAKREAALKDGMPTAKLLWHFCVLLCGELFNGEHKMSPSDAQLLGIVDEVIGGGPIESRRDFERNRSTEQ